MWEDNSIVQPAVPHHGKNQGCNNNYFFFFNELFSCIKGSLLRGNF